MVITFAPILMDYILTMFRFICGVTTWYYKLLKVTGMGFISPMSIESHSGECVSANNCDSHMMRIRIV